tara:strand:+ start:748 stop:1023 length:276 start_codon:yes stop_codon:yes gene_type:complete
MNRGNENNNSKERPMRNEIEDMKITTKPFQFSSDGREIRFRLMKNEIGYFIQMEEKKGSEWRKATCYSSHLEEYLTLQMMEALSTEEAPND